MKKNNGEKASHKKQNKLSGQTLREQSCETILKYIVFHVGRQYENVNIYKEVKLEKK